MKTLLQGSLILSRTVRALRITRRRSLFALFATLACSSLLLFNGPWAAQSQTRKAPRAVSHRAKKIATRKPAKTDRDRRAEPREGVADDPEGRLNWFWFQRTYPFNEIPERARGRAWDSAPQREKGASTLATTWSSIGPAPTTSAFPANGGVTSGRINAIAVSPTNTQIVLIGSATGGIWRSTNGGTSFAPVTDNQVDLSVGTIAFAPSNANIVYAGMGDRDNGYFGTGVLKSADAGATWTKVSNTLVLPDKGQCMRILVDPTDPNKVYLAEDTFLDPPTNGRFVAGVYVSVDGGVNWTNPLGNSSVRDLAIHPTNSQIIYAAVQFTFNAGQSPGVYKSTNGGTTWAQVYVSPSAPGTRDIHVAVTPANANRVYAFFGSTNSPNQVQVEMSDDAGVNWTTRGVISNTQLDPEQFGYNTYLAASTTDANTIYVGARDVFRSTDAGVTFTDLTNSFASPYTPTGAFTPNLQKFHADQQSFAFQPGSSTIFYAGCDGGLYKTTDSGATFTSENTSLSLTQFVSIGVHPTDGTKSYGGTQDNGTQRRTGGAAWTEFSGGDGGKLVVNPLNAAMVFPSYVSGVINRYLTNGVDYDGQIADADSFGETKGSARIGFYPPIVGNGVDAKIYVGTWRLFICTDCNDSNKVYGTATPPTWTAPGGTTDLTSGGADVLNAIAVARSNNNVIYTGSRSGHAMVSVNAGATWADITTGLPTRTITSIKVSPTDPTLVFLTVSGYGSGHIFRSTNSGNTWTDISNNLPNIPTSDFLIDPLIPTTFYAGTDLGVFRSTNSGTTWTVFNDGLPPVPVMAFTTQATGLIQIGTYGRGAYELPVGAPAANTIQLSGPAYAITEGALPGVAVTVTRSGDISAAATVGYATSDTAGTNCNTFNGAASSKCDYLATIGTLQFAAGQGSKDVVIPIVNDSYAEGPESFFFTLSNPTGGATLGTPATAVITITDNETTNGPNPVDTTNFFVRQHYVDFLNREPDAGGLAFWTGEIDNCTPKPTCTDLKRINVSAAFFISVEFQGTGYLVERIYKSSYGDTTGTSTFGGTHQLSVPIVRLNEFLPDTQQIGQGVIVGVGNWQAQLEANTVAFTTEFVQRARFTTAFPTTQAPATFVDKLFLNAGVTPVAADRTAAINEFGGAATIADAAARGRALRRVAENSTLATSEYNRAFVLMQYFGYLRRNPNDPQDTDFSGYDFWLTKLNSFTKAGDDVLVRVQNAEMVKAFITSGEYRQRFGP